MGYEFKIKFQTRVNIYNIVIIIKLFEIFKLYRGHQESLEKRSGKKRSNKRSGTCQEGSLGTADAGEQLSNHRDKRSLGS